MISDDDIRREFLAAGFEVKPGHDDLKPYVYEAARRVLALATARLESEMAQRVAAPYKPQADTPECWACNDTKAVTTSSNGSGLFEAQCLACADDDDGRCPTCGEDGGTSCGLQNCGMLHKRV